MEEFYARLEVLKSFNAKVVQESVEDFDRLFYFCQNENFVVSLCLLAIYYSLDYFTYCWQLADTSVVLWTFVLLVSLSWENIVA